MSLDKFIGGNRVQVAEDSIVRDFVVAHGGHTVITKVLIANNGIGAVKEIRSVRQWAYSTFNDERAIKFIAMASPEDLQANAEYIKMADMYVEVPGGSNNNNYSNVDLIVDIAERTGAHAVWAGWGHASENPRLPEKLGQSKNKIVFIGPPSSAMHSLGDKISSTIVAQSAKVPTMPWSGDGIEEIYTNEDGCVNVEEHIYLKATTSSVEEGLQQAKRIGFPVMIKASEGGGGKGIRMCHKEEDFTSLFSMCQNEVPGSPIFIMKLANESRHLEVQILGDQYGNVISLFGRDCSVQRRHQKIIEEAPVTIAPKSTFREMEKAAVRLGKLVGYASAGTIEYLYIPKEDKFYFLELNPRLQVEHPTTEMVSGVNLPAAQLLVAMGIPLSRNQDIRKMYGADINGTSEINFNYDNQNKNQAEPKPNGHVIAVRITAENPEAGFKPSSGTVESLNFKSNPNVWGYFSVAPSGGLHEYADSQFGHIFAFGSSREKARQSMVIALKEILINGEFRTTVGYLITLLELEDFRRNNITTAWLDRLIASHLVAERPDPILTVICGAACRAYQESLKLINECKITIEKGQMLSSSQLINKFNIEFNYDDFRYKFTAYRTGSNTFTLEINDSYVKVELRMLLDGGILVSVNGHSHPCYLRQEVGAIRMQIDEHTVLLEEEVDPTQLRTQSPGKLVRYLVETGTSVEEGQAYAEIEVMKMYMSLVSSEKGVVHFIKPAGSVISAGELLGTLTLADPSKVKKSKPFTQKLPAFGTPHAQGTKPHQRMVHLISEVNNVLEGYYESEPIPEVLKELSTILSLRHEVPYLSIFEIISSLQGRIPISLEKNITFELEKSQKRGTTFPAKVIISHIDNELKKVDLLDFPKVSSAVKPLYDFAELYIGGLKSYENYVYTTILDKFYSVETIFCYKNSEEIIAENLRSIKSKNIDNLITCLKSHAGVETSAKLILEILEINKSSLSNKSNTLNFKYESSLKQLAGLTSRVCSKVALKAREILIDSQIPSVEERERQMEQILTSSVTEYIYGQGIEYHTPSYDVIKNLIDSNYYVFDVLQTFFYHRTHWVRLAAIETYVRRAYHIYSICNIEYMIDARQPFTLCWSFYLPAEAMSMFTPNVAKNKSEMMRILSVSDLSLSAENSSSEGTEIIRHGVMSSFDSFEEMADGFETVLQQLPTGSEASSRSVSPAPFDSRQQLGSTTPRGKPHIAPLSSINTSDKALSVEHRRIRSRLRNVINIAFRIPQDDSLDDEYWQKKLGEFTKSYTSELRQHGVRRITFLLFRSSIQIATLTYRETLDYNEDTTIRHVEPALAYQLELSRLSNYNIIPCLSGNPKLHIYRGISKENPADTRIFIRVLVRQGGLKTELQTVDYLISETDRLLTDILDQLEVLMDQFPNIDCNHLFINFLPIFNLDSSQFEPAYRGFLDRHGDRLFRLRVSASEIKFLVQTGGPDDQPTPIRFCVFNELGFVPKLESYIETLNRETNDWVLQSLDSPPGSLDKVPASHPYKIRDPLQSRRYKAHVMGTAYVYDYPSLFHQALINQWHIVQKRNKKAHQPLVIMKEYELVWNKTENKLEEVSRPPGQSTSGTVAWLFEMFTPECPSGRRIVVIANDITYQAGSFGVDEDLFFYRVTQYARKHGIPRVYLSANSGARVGLASEVIKLFKSSFIDPNYPERGFEYLYLTEEGKQALDKLSEGKSQSVVTEQIVGPDGEIRHKLTAVIGMSGSLGVENLMGSGLIAGETSRAYGDIFTITLVTCRSVGIGAYLVRLGQRTVQNEGHPILLTGNKALNKVLGRDVYTSNLQLGGTQIMYKNGVSHLTAKNDFAGVIKILRWLSFIPPYKGAPIVPAKLLAWDPVERKIEYCPPKGPSDPRNFLNGVEVDGVWQSGFFDRDSFVEVLAGWAQTVVTGRARIGGIPTGVISVETRMVENVTPADPANLSSQEQVTMEAGGVWYPNSAYKTAQSIRDFNNGEGLPLFIFANWRGFSGGQRDMYDQILKFGSYIVDALTEYRQPVFVYIVPNGELRGGAWVVLDSSINSDVMEMYADKTARGGVIEAQGIVEIKFRKPMLIATMERLDPVMKELKNKLNSSGISEFEKNDAKKKIDERIKLLYPVYSQIAVEFADLHDRPGRMHAKKAIRKILEWPNTREYFYHRLRRRLKEDSLRSEIRKVYPNISRSDQIRHLQLWYISDKNQTSDTESIKQIIESEEFRSNWEENDKEIWKWLEENYESFLSRIRGLLRNQKLVELKEIASKNPSFAKDAASMLLSLLDPEAKSKLIESMGDKQQE
ncbi:hypothetical protein BB559_001149 [Furculomyces boomerangus]|uniref:Uncharacterized protein n=2 Tax=Harpellales TaxID=61421 RepID=A0A2T9Z2X4_9FUNG|nr:hypothetical protein BB559_001149 [Furculomyces boomerangus]PVZ98393.1 hypothetical protein BB558_005612 [Smittium angustum]